MLGEKLCDARGKRVVRRILSADPLKVEVTFEDGGKVLGVDYKGFGTYCSEVRADGSIYGEGNGAFVTNDGDLVSWRGTGLGRLLPGGAASYRGMAYFRTGSKKLVALNTVAGAFEFDTDADGNTQMSAWEWK